MVHILCIHDRQKVQRNDITKICVQMHFFFNYSLEYCIRVTIFSSLSPRLLIKHQVLSTSFIVMLEAEPEMQPCMVCISALLILSGTAS